jgi:hypothetical protein
MMRQQNDQLKYFVDAWISIFLGPNKFKKVPSMLVRKFKQLLLDLDAEWKTADLLEKCKLLDELCDKNIDIVIDRKHPFNLFMIQHLEAFVEKMPVISRAQFEKAKVALQKAEGPPQNEARDG